MVNLFHYIQLDRFDIESMTYWGGGVGLSLFDLIGRNPYVLKF